MHASLVSFRQFKKSIRFALTGLGYAWRHEQNFRLQVFVGVIAVGAALVLELSALRVVMVLLLVTMVLVLELLNTFFEKLVDLLAPRVHPYVALLKDLLAATVFVASAGALAVGILLFWPAVRALGG